MNILDIYTDLGKHIDDRFMAEIFREEVYEKAKPKLTIFDLGAFEGEFSFYCLPFAETVYAFEPDPRPFKVFNDRVRAYGLDKVIKPMNIAVSGTTGERFFHSSGYGGSSLKGAEDIQGEDLKVESVTVADFMNMKKIDHIDILKIDVESSEREIFSHPSFAECSKSIKYIIGEDHSGGTFSELLTPLGYTVTVAGSGVWEAKR